MRKIIFIFFSLTVFLAACGTSQQPPGLINQPTAAPSTQTLPVLRPEPTTTLKKPTAAPTATDQGNLFVSIYHSTNTIHLKCDPLEIIFDVTVDDPNVDRVIFFFRMQDKVTDIASDWSNGERMKTPGNGNFEFILRASAIPDEARYKEAWLEYQLIAENKLEQAVGRSPVFEKEITFTAGCAQ